MNYEIIASGSTGNAVVIGTTLIDCGIPFNRIKPFIYNVKTLLITHIHTDHIKKATYNKIRKLYPRITVVGNHEVHQMYSVDIVSNPGFEFESGGIKYLPFEAPHGVECHGYVWEVDGQRVIYSTDLWTMEHAPEGPYDYLFIESNHDELKLAEIMGKTYRGYDPWKASKQHLSRQKSKEFYYVNRRDEESEWIELHKSERFY